MGNRACVVNYALIIFSLHEESSDSEWPDHGSGKRPGLPPIAIDSVSYTHLTLPTNREV